ncbi:MAG TPA: asparagine synthase (glutamine-hydrolyzing) [Thermoanaerobaculia bacterium]
MCGLTGVIAAASAGDLQRDVRRMCEAIAHRGPDDAGEWVDESAGVALGFRRLAVIDRSAAGHQPMASASGRYVATLNGEIYNFERLRGELPPISYRGHSDTEVMVAAFDAWGVEQAVERFNGMFSIAIWDRERRRLHLVRDRMGVKPLYYGFTGGFAGGFAGGAFVFASELKAIRQHPLFVPRIDRGAVRLYLRFLYVPAPFSIFEGIHKAMPGTVVTFDPSTRSISTHVYASARTAASAGTASRFTGSEADAERELESLLRDSVRLRMVADVPVGVFLSGGIDSSLVAALMQEECASPIRTFTIGFRDSAFDESPFARRVAQHLGTNHTEALISEQEALEVIPRLPDIYDEPFADVSQIPTYLVAKMARSQVTVTLSGDGGDELFGGYDRYLLSRRLANVRRWLPPLIGRSMSALSRRGWDRLFVRRDRQRVEKIARVLQSPDDDAAYFELLSHSHDELVIDAPRAEVPAMLQSEWPPLQHPIERMMLFDQISYLPDDILTKVDRATMAVSLEAREPLLDPRIVELAWRLPPSMKFRGGQGKYILRRILRRHVPEALTDRPKMGFGVPLAAWLRGPLRAWAGALLDPDAIRQHGLLDPEPIRLRWEEHLSGRSDWKFYLWGVLMLQLWLARWDDPPKTR